MSGDDLLHPALRQATAQGVDVRIRCLEEMKAADQRPDRLAGKGLLRLPDDDIRPGVTAAVEDHKAPRRLKDQALLMGEIIGGILAVAEVRPKSWTNMTMLFLTVLGFFTGHGDFYADSSCSLY